MTATTAKTKRVRVNKVAATPHPAIKAITSTNHKTTPVPPKAAKPKAVKYDFQPGWTGDSSGVNLRVSRTPIPVDRFGTSQGPLTDRDRANLAELRQQFGGKAFERANLDAGILRRLGERGYLSHVSGEPSEESAKFKLTNKKAA